jgi:hypothetical protein
MAYLSTGLFLSSVGHWSTRLRMEALVEIERVECIVPLGSADFSFSDRNIKCFQAGGIYQNVTSVDDVTAREAIGSRYVFEDQLQFNSDIIEMCSKFFHIFRFKIILVFIYIFCMS